MSYLWAPGSRYSYRQWSRRERHAEARTRQRERARIAELTDYSLAVYLEMHAGNVDVSWCARVSYRAAHHEAITVRGWSQASNPKL